MCSIVKDPVYKLMLVKVITSSFKTVILLCKALHHSIIEKVFTEAQVLLKSEICMKCLPVLGVFITVRSVGSLTRNYRF